MINHHIIRTTTGEMKGNTGFKGPLAIDVNCNTVVRFLFASNSNLTRALDVFESDDDVRDIFVDCEFLNTNHTWIWLSSRVQKIGMRYQCSPCPGWQFCLLLFNQLSNGLASIRASFGFDLHRLTHTPKQWGWYNKNFGRISFEQQILGQTMTVFEHFQVISHRLTKCDAHVPVWTPHRRSDRPERNSIKLFRGIGFNDEIWNKTPYLFGPDLTPRKPRIEKTNSVHNIQLKTILSQSLSWSCLSNWRRN